LEDSGISVLSGKDLTFFTTMYIGPDNIRPFNPGGITPGQQKEGGRENGTTISQINLR
jgi:hypothetical protein